MSPTLDELSRLERLHRVRRTRKVVTIVLACALVVGALAAGYAGWRALGQRRGQPPQRVVVIGESELEDGTTVAGLIAVLDASGGTLRVQGIDSGRKVVIPGTSYHRLREALSVGDADLVTRLATNDEDAEWVLLSESEWPTLLESDGGVKVKLDAPTTVFTGNKLFRFSPGRQQVAGERAAALARGSESLGDAAAGREVRIVLAEALGSSISQKDPGSLVEQTGAQLSNAARIEAFLNEVR